MGHLGYLLQCGKIGLTLSSAVFSFYHHHLQKLHDWVLG
jgi:hypothetical protein